MKLKFKNQEFQNDAVNAVCNLFLGQQNKYPVSTVDQEGISYNKFGFGNALKIDNETIIKNMQEVQRKNNLPLTYDLNGKQFCIEMETGTGKTYVYTKTIFELNKRYGFKKFIIVVPSIAIREGVYKSLQVTQEHFRSIYNNVPNCYFIYNSTKLSDIRQFTASNIIEIMIINIDAFKKAQNVINHMQEGFGGETAMKFIQSTNPIVIIDEPQSVDSTIKSKNAIKELNPLCVLKYSATHREKINLLYRLTPIDAYQKGLVKQIIVESVQVVNDYNKPYIKLLSVSHKNGYSAKIEIDIQNKSKAVTRKAVTVKQNDDLFILSGNRKLYENLSITNIDCFKGKECIEISKVYKIKLGDAIGSVDEIIIKKEQIYRTIETHLDKELLYLNKGIKVLSLFFIDEVKNYRTVEGEKGIYAKLFEECYTELIQQPRYAEIKEKFTSNVSSIHDGYFSQDKKGVFKNTKGDTLADNDTYNTIMKDKEWLLSFECPLRFIWSHSALKEGWDNPNIFQICTLIEQKSALTCRQKIGRGLRLCVNQKGERIEDKNINLLTIIGTESFNQFANSLQKEIEQETGIKFGVLEINLFCGLVYNTEENIERTMRYKEAAELVKFFEEKSYITKNGEIKDAMKDALSTGKLELPKKYKTAREKLENIILNASYKLPIHIASRKVLSTMKNEAMALSDRSNQETACRIRIDTEKLIHKCVEDLKEMPPIPKVGIAMQSANINIEKRGISYKECGLQTTNIKTKYERLPDILKIVSEECLIKRSTVGKIILESRRELDFIRNPQMFLEKFLKIIQNNIKSVTTEEIKNIKSNSKEHFQL